MRSLSLNILSEQHVLSSNTITKTNAFLTVHGYRWEKRFLEGAFADVDAGIINFHGIHILPVIGSAHLPYH